jgi:UDP-glucose 4-epimerase
MKILITGGAGFIASHIADKYIDMGYDVDILDNLSTGRVENLNPKARFYNMDINDDGLTELFAQNKYDAISHHAAQMNVRFSVANPIIDAKTNILGSINIFEAARLTGVKKIIFASSGGTVYGEQFYFPANEQDPTNPCSPYGIAKLSIEKYLFYYEQVYGLKSAILRYGNVYGIRQNPKGEAGVVAIFIQKMLDGQQAIINGDGEITRDYIHIDDVVNANVLALDENINGIFNITTGVETNVNYIFHKIKELTLSNCEEFHGPALKGEQRRSVCSYEKFNKVSGWKPKLSFDDGMALTVKQIKNEQ